MAKKKGVTTNLAGKSAKHKNHTVPKGLLKRWLAENEGKKGYWVLDCNSGTVQFRKGENASFAIKEFRYVPVRYTKEGTAYRDEWLEDWFSHGESDLAAVTDQILKGQYDAIKDKARDSFIGAAIMLGFRSAYEFSCLETLIREENPDCSDESIGRQVVDHFRSLHATKIQQFESWSFTLHGPTKEPLLIGDRPLFDMTLTASNQQGVYIPLTPEILLVGRPSNDPNFKKNKRITSIESVSQELTPIANNMTVERARQFIVGKKEQLLALRPRFIQQTFAERKSQDSFVVLSNGEQSGRGLLV